MKYFIYDVYIYNGRRKALMEKALKVGIYDYGVNYPYCRLIGIAKELGEK